MRKSIFSIGSICLLIFACVDIYGASPTDIVFQPTCPVNEEYNECGSACPPSCSDLFYPMTPKFCSQQCVSGCFCKTGLYRARNGECVKPENCCTGRNEAYTSCGTACPETCTYKPEMCIAMCRLGCFCLRGFIRKDNSPNSPCILPSQC